MSIEEIFCRHGFRVSSFPQGGCMIADNQVYTVFMMTAGESFFCASIPSVQKDTIIRCYMEDNSLRLPSLPCWLNSGTLQIDRMGLDGNFELAQISYWAEQAESLSRLYA